MKLLTLPWGAPVVALLILTAGATDAAANLMPTGKTTTQPIGHYEFCQRHPEECQANITVNGPLRLTRELWARMVEINNTVNSSIQPRTDMELWGVEEYWSYPELYGDCEDYVLEKRRQLIEAGIPAGNLLITVVLQPSGEGHAVLTVNTDMGDFILDNMEQKILPWSQTPYRYLKRQSANHPMRWVSINDGRDPAVASISFRR